MDGYTVGAAARQSGSILFSQLRDLVNRVLAEPA